MCCSQAVAAYHTTERRHQTNVPRSISSISHNTTNTARCELDSHADTCALGANFVPLHFTGRVCDVSPYNANTYSPERDIQIVSAATAYTDQTSGQTYILVINEGLWFGEKLSNTLLNPNQLRYSGVTVFDNPFDRENPISIHHEEVIIPLLQSGTTLFLETSTPTSHELNTCPHITLTFDTEWNPHTVNLSATRSEEAEMQTICGDETDNHPGLQRISSMFSMPEMAESLNQQRRISVIDVEERKTFASKERHPVITKETLSERWNIGLVQAQQTLRVTTQRGVRSAILPLSRRYPSEGRVC